MVKNVVIRNTLSIIAGIIVGSCVNMGIIMISGKIIPPPDGVDLRTSQGLKEAMNIMEPKHFIMPFLAHALGTFFGSLLTAYFSVKHPMKFAFVIGGWFLIGGAYVNLVMLPSPIWFTVLDLTLAYIPMSYIAVRLSRNKG